MKKETVAYSVVGLQFIHHMVGDIVVEDYFGMIDPDQCILPDDTKFYDCYALLPESHTARRGDVEKDYYVFIKPVVEVIASVVEDGIHSYNMTDETTGWDDWFARNDNIRQLWQQVQADEYRGMTEFRREYLVCTLWKCVEVLNDEDEDDTDLHVELVGRVNLQRLASGDDRRIVRPFEAVQP